ncbi:MAG: putative transport system ATP-binding protein [Microbacteriaceae bacterium]|jgi:putative ABC transport system ATP-binding protein|nr:putative transport system ATP-binding protein [Microbacteriaceae bacterium]
MTASESTIVASARGVGKTYGTGEGVVTALRHIDLDIERGKLTAIMGPSGSGKSTLMHMLAGLDTPTSGRVIVGKSDLSGLDDDQLTVLRRRQIGFVFQAFNLVPTLTVMGNVLLPFELDGVKPTAEHFARVRNLLAGLGLGAMEGRRPHELSGGQQQRVAIVRALAMQPSLIFADEPTGSLDSRSGREVLSILRQSTSEFGQSVVLVTHDPVAASYADRVVFIADGRIARDVSATDAKTLSEIALDLEVRA